MNIQTQEGIFWGIWIVLGLAMLIFYARSRHPVRAALLGMAPGGAALLAAHFWGGALGASLTVNLLHTIAALILGLPGVLMLGVVHLFMG